MELDHIYCGDARQILATWPDQCVNMCVTSPPYYGLRDYGIEGQIGLEESPDAYAARLVEVFRECKRVLRDDGTLWLVIGDSYARNPGRGVKFQAGDTTYMTNRQAIEGNRGPSIPQGMKEKDLIGIPWMLAFALRADGWYLRSDIIWSKPNPMPESVTDRCTRSHEYVFLLSKSARYYYDNQAISEESAPSSVARSQYNGGNPSPKNLQGVDEGVWCGPMSTAKAYGQGRNRRSVWTIATKPYKEAHFATFPPELIELCIKAGTSERGCCPECGASWVRVTDKPQPPEEIRNRGNGAKMDFHTRSLGGGQKLQDWYNQHPGTTKGWKPSCNCDAGDPVPCVVLDPFMGSGTTASVALSLKRHYVGIELNPKYIELCTKRIRNTVVPLFV